jgi:hypothetical protein
LEENKMALTHREYKLVRNLGIAAIAVVAGGFGLIYCGLKGQNQNQDKPAQVYQETITSPDHSYQVTLDSTDIQGTRYCAAKQERSNLVQD